MRPYNLVVIVLLSKQEAWKEEEEDRDKDKAAAAANSCAALGVGEKKNIETLRAQVERPEKIMSTEQTNKLGIHGVGTRRDWLVFAV